MSTSSFLSPTVSTRSSTVQQAGGIVGQVGRQHGVGQHGRVHWTGGQFSPGLPGHTCGPVSLTGRLMYWGSLLTASLLMRLGIDCTRVGCNTDFFCLQEHVS
uniref:Uncharacterized protein n=1 Tax=Cacopsylla melanoneura TaxID=428564 RepID=A0A8D8ZA51_9HEMI